MSRVKTRGKYIKQINNIKINYNVDYGYYAVSPNKEILNHGMELEDAELYCARNKDYIVKRGKKNEP